MEFKKPPTRTPKNADDFIQQGGAVAKRQAASSPKEEQIVNLRVPVELLQRVDAVRRARPLKISRHAWLLEAIYKQLLKEE
jgi:hypothetical protein